MKLTPLTSLWKHLPLMFLIFCIILAFQYGSMTKNYTDNPPQLQLNKKATLMSYFHEPFEIGKVQAGDTVRVLGLEGPGQYTPYSLLVETSNGLRGQIYINDLSFPIINKKKRDTVTILDIAKKKEGKCNILRADGTKEEARIDQWAPVVSDELRHLSLSNEGHYYMSIKKFERLYMGKTLSECDHIYRPAITIRNGEGNSRIATYRTLMVFNPDDGKLYHPEITFTGDSLIATNYEMLHPYGNSAWLLKWLPFSSTILDCAPLASLIEEPLYDPWMKVLDYDTTLDGEANWFHWVCMGFYLLFGFIWAFCMVGFPLKLMEAMMHFRFSFYHLSDTVLASLMAIVAFIWTYIWTILIMTWGLIWLLVWICWIIAPIIFTSATNDLNQQPHKRCESCRRMYTMEAYEKQFIREYDEWRTVSKRGALLSQFTRHWTTYTKTTYSDGSTSNSNYQNHSETESTYAVHHYSVLYHVKEYDYVFKCTGCGHEERFRDEELKELDRKYLSSGTFVETT